MTNQILISTIELRGGGRLVNKSHFCKPTIKRKISRARQSFWTGNKEFCRAIMLISLSLKLLLQKIIVLWGILWCTKSVICLVRTADSGCVCVSWSVYLFEERLIRTMGLVLNLFFCCAIVFDSLQNKNDSKLTKIPKDWIFFLKLFLAMCFQQSYSIFFVPKLPRLAYGTRVVICKIFDLLFENRCVIVVIHRFA